MSEVNGKIPNYDSSIEVTLSLPPLMHLAVYRQADGAEFDAVVQAGEADGHGRFALGQNGRGEAFQAERGGVGQDDAPDAALGLEAQHGVGPGEVQHADGAADADRAVRRVIGGPVMASGRILRGGGRCGQQEGRQQAARQHGAEPHGYASPGHGASG